MNSIYRHPHDFDIEVIQAIKELQYALMARVEASSPWAEDLCEKRIVKAREELDRVLLRDED